MHDIRYDSSPRLLVVLVTHNGGAWLADCLDALNDQLYPMIDLVVVDNGSEIPAALIVARHAPRAELVWSERNLGFGAACNAGLESSSKTAIADFFLFIHDDVALEPEACSMLIASAIETGAGVIGGKGLDWNHPEALVEVGMSADQFCSPYSGLEEGEIDQGQYERLKETLYVSNACFLVSREVAERCGLWDGAYFALGEDLDLCIRARLAGFKVMVAPAARFRHAEALTNDLREVPAIPSKGLLARRNQLRTIAKNASLPWMLFSLTSCVLLGLAKVVVLVLFRRFHEVPDYPRAFGDFLKAFPNIMLRRRAVQKRRKVPDRGVRRFMIKDSHRLRVQLERRLRHWERGTAALGAKTLSQLSLPSLKETFTGWLRQPTTISLGIIVLLLVFATRQILFGEPLAAGGLWPFPARPGRFLTDYLSGWRDTGLGTESAAPTAFPLLWGVGLLSFGSQALAQKLLVAILIGLGLLGMYRLMRASTTCRPAWIVGVGLYALGPVVHAMVSGADLGAMAAFAGLPYMLHLMLRVLSAGAATKERSKDLRPSVPERLDALTSATARLALIAVPVVALGPSNLVAIALLMGVFCVYFAIALGPAGRPWDRAQFVVAALPVTALLLIPWSLEGLRPSGAILGPAFSGRTGSYFPLWSQHSFQDMLLLNLDSRPAALVVIAVTLGALLLASPARRAESRLLATTLVCFAFIGGLAGKGLIPPPVASPVMWMTFSLALVAIMGGHLVAGIQEELPKHAFGWRHKVAIPLVSVAAAAGVLIGWVPQLVGWERPRATFAGGTDGFSASIASFLQTTATEVGDFRVLWLGKRWADPVRAGLPPRDGIDYFLTGANGLTMLEAVAPPPAAGERKLDDVIDALMGSRLHLAGHLLAPANVRFVIVDTEDRQTLGALSRQRDIALEQQQSGVAMFRNLLWLPRASLVPAGLAAAMTAENSGDTALLLADWSGGREIPSRSPSSFTAQLPRTRHTHLLVGDNFNPAWKASVEGNGLAQRQAFGWANQFSLPRDARGEVKVFFGGNWVRFIWLLIQVALLVAVTTMAGTIAGTRR